MQIPAVSCEFEKSVNLFSLPYIPFDVESEFQFTPDLITLQSELRISAPNLVSISDSITFLIPTTISFFDQLQFSKS